MPVKIDELYYELDARTQGFEDKLNHAKGSISNFADFVMQKPVLAMGALAASMAAVAFEATKMAAEVDASLRQVAAAAPEAGKHMQALRDIVANMSEITPRSQAELAAAADLIAHNGAESITEISTRLQIATKVADASGTDLGTVIEGLSAVAKAFGLQGKDAADALTRLFAAAQGRAEFEETFQVLRRSGSVLASLGVTAGQAGDAMTALLKGGIIPRQAGYILSQLIDLTGKVQTLKKGTDEQAQAASVIESTMSRGNIAAKGFTVAIGELASGIKRAQVDVDALGIKQAELNAIQRVAAATAADHRTEDEKLADAEKKLAAAAEVNRGSAEALAKLLKNELNESLLTLGNEILPTVISGLKMLNDLFRELHGNANPLKDVDVLSKGIPKVTQLGPHDLKRGSSRPSGGFLGGMNADEKYADNFWNSLNDLAGATQKNGVDALAGVPVDKLKAIGATLDMLFKQNPEKLTSQLDGLTVAIRQAIAVSDDASTKPKDLPKKALTVDPLTQEVKNAILSLRRSINEALASETQTQIDDARVKLKKFQDDVDELARKAGYRGPGGRDAFLKTQPDLSAEYQRLQGLPAVTEQKERKKATDDMQDMKAKFGSGTSDAFSQEITKSVAKMVELNAELAKLHLAPLFSQSDIDRITVMNNSLKGTATAIQTANVVLDAQRTSTRTDRLNEAIEINNQIGILDTKKAQAKSDKERQDIETEILKLEQRMKDLGTEQQTATTKANEERIKKVDELQHEAISVIDTAVQTASEFGKMDEHTAAIVTGLKDGVNAAAEFAKGDIVGGVLDAISGVVSVAHGLGLGQRKTEAQKAYEKLLDQNTQAILKLNEHIGLLGTVTATGAQQSAFGQVLARTDITGETKYNSQQQTYAIQAQLQSMGYTIQDFRDYAKSLGVTLPDAIGGAVFRQLQTAAAAATPQVAQYTNTFQGQLSAVQQAVNLFDVVDPVKQFQQFTKAIQNVAGGGGAISQAIQGFDVTSAQGILDAKKQLQSLFDAAQAGTLNTAQLGGLSGQDFIDALTQTKSYLDNISQAHGYIGTGGYNISQDITEATGGRIAAQIYSSNTFLEQIAFATAMTARLLGGTTVPLPSVSPPTLPSIGSIGSGGSGLSGASVINVVINVDGSMIPDTQTAQALGSSLGNTFVTEVNRALSGQSILANMAAGTTLSV